MLIKFVTTEGKIEVPALFYYGMIYLRVLWRSLNAESLQFFKPRLSSGKSLRNHFFGSIPMHMKLVIFFVLFFWMIFSSTWSVCSVLQLPGYYLAACGWAWKVAQSATETFRWAVSNQITGTFGNAGKVFGGFQLEVQLLPLWLSVLSKYSVKHIGSPRLVRFHLVRSPV